MIEGFHLSILGPALLAGLLVLATHVPLGRQVIRRGIIFLDLAIAQIAGFGVLLVEVMGWHGAGQQLVAYAAGILAALVLYGCEQRWGEVQEASIGVAFILAASAGMLVLAGSPQGGEHLHSLLAGQILWVDYAQLGPLAVLYLLVLIAWFTFGQRSSLVFYLLFAVTVTASVQLVGVYLVFATLIIPALAVRRKRRGLLWAYVIGAVGYTAGLAASAYWDLPAGPVIVWALAGAALMWNLMRRHSA